MEACQQTVISVKKMGCFANRQIKKIFHEIFEELNKNMIKC